MFPGGTPAWMPDAQARARLLLEAGADAGARNRHGRTPADLAAENGQAAAQDLLMESMKETRRGKA